MLVFNVDIGTWPSLCFDRSLDLQNKENELTEVVLDIQIQQFSRNHGQIKRDDNKVTGKLDCMLVVSGKKQRLFTVRQKRKMM